MMRLTCKRLLGLCEATYFLPHYLRRAYHERVIEHFNNPKHVGSFDKNDPNVGTGLVGAPACGDVMKFQIKVDPDTGVVTDVCNKNFGCAAAIASASVAAEWAKGKRIEEALTIKNKDIANYLALPPVKLHCSMLAEDGMKAAVKEYKAKHAAQNGGQEAGPTEKAGEA